MRSRIELLAHTHVLHWCLSVRLRLGYLQQKVDNQRDDFNSRFSELSLKLDEIPRALAALQATPTTRETGFTFRTADDKLLLQTHLHRREGSYRSGGGPYTDLQPFTIPDDMKAKVEMRIRERELRKEEADAQAAAELAEAYRRLLLASNPRLSEVRLQVDQCQEQLKHAFQMIRDSNLHLYSCCESKAEKMDFAAVQSELKALRSRLRELEIAGTHRIKHPPLAMTTSSAVVGKQQQQPKGIESLMVSTVKDRALATGSSNANAPLLSNNNALPTTSGVQLTAGQIPELRVCLLELSRNFNLLKLQWKKKHQQKGLNPVVKTHMEKVVAMIADAYSATAEEPVDLVAVARHVEKVSRILGSDFSMHVLGMLGYPNAQDDHLRRSIAANDIVPALCRYSELFTDSLRGGSNSAQSASPSFSSPMAKAIPATPAAKEPSSSDSSSHSLERMQLEMEALVHNQRRLEAALAELTATAHARSSEQDAGAVVAPAALMVDAITINRLAQPDSVQAGDATSSVTDELHRLRNEITAMRSQFVSEDTLSDVLRQLDVWKTERDRSSGVVGHRYPSTLFQRHNSASSSGTDSTDYSLTAALDPLDRPKSQPKLDPLQIHKLSGEVRPGRTAALAHNNGAVLSGRVTALSKLQTRSQMLRPKSSVQPQLQQQ